MLSVRGSSTEADDRNMPKVKLKQTLNRAFKYHKAEQWRKAKVLYQRILNAYPDQPEALHLLGLLTFEIGEQEKAAELLYKAVDKIPGNAQAQFHLGVALHALGRLEDAISPYQHTVALEPDNAIALNNLGIVQEDLGLIKEAIGSYRQAIDSNPDYAGAIINLGTAYRAHGEPQEAAKLFREALEHKSDSPEIHFNLGLTLTDLAEPLTAADSFQKAIDLRPGYAAAHEKLGNMLREQARFDLALNSYRTALDHDPRLVSAHVSLAKTLNELERHNDAINHSQHALNIEPDSASARHNLAHCYWKLERYADALKLFETLDTPVARARTLECLFAMKSYDTFYDSQKQPAPGWDTNLRIAAINAFAAEQLQHINPHPYCKRPLDFIRVYDALYERPDRTKFLADLVAMLERQPMVWEPFGKSTVSGYQTPAVLFNRPEGPLAELQGILEDHIGQYSSEAFNESGIFLDQFPARYTLQAWYGKLIKGGHRKPHIHPSGWLSGVFYIQCPRGGDKDEGAIDFSTWGYGYPLINKNYSRHRHRPKNGDLVLFPSSLFHGTVPIHTDEERLIVAFDLVPRND